MKTEELPSAAVEWGGGASKDMLMTADEKITKLRQILKNTGGAVIAFSGGVDSTFLAAVAVQELGERALAVTALSPTYPASEQEEAGRLAKLIGIRHELVESNELEIPGYAENPVNRCYFCKKELFTILQEIAKKHGISFVLDGSNADDLNDYRPGRKAAAELRVLSPLMEAGIGKKDIRAFSKAMNLPTADKPAYACLASRFPYGTEITGDKLRAVDAVESQLRAAGFRQVRVRHHGEICRIEVEEAEIGRISSEPARSMAVKAARAAGFKYVSVDLQGYRTGSMNEVL